MQANEYLDAAKVALKVESDYQLAKKIEARKQEICAIRKGERPLNSYVAARVSDVTGIPLEKVIADVEANDKNEQRAAYWRERAARKVAGFFLSVLIGGSLGVMQSGKVSAAESYEVSARPETLMESSSASGYLHSIQIMRQGITMLRAFVTRIIGLARSNSANGHGRIAFEGL